MVEQRVQRGTGMIDKLKDIEFYCGMGDIGFIYNMDFNRMKKWLHEKEK